MLLTFNISCADVNVVVIYTVCPSEIVSKLRHTRSRKGADDGRLGYRKIAGKFQVKVLEISEMARE